jgi:hypothetical protein
MQTTNAPESTTHATESDGQPADHADSTHDAHEQSDQGNN